MARVEGRFFTTTEFDTLWAPLSALAPPLSPSSDVLCENCGSRPANVRDGFASCCRGCALGRGCTCVGSGDEAMVFGSDGDGNGSGSDDSDDDNHDAQGEEETSVLLSWRPSIRKVLEQVHPGARLTTGAARALGSILEDAAMSLAQATVHAEAAEAANSGAPESIPVVSGGVTESTEDVNVTQGAPDASISVAETSDSTTAAVDVTDPAASESIVATSAHATESSENCAGTTPASASPDGISPPAPPGTESTTNGPPDSTGTMEAAVLPAPGSRLLTAKHVESALSALLGNSTELLKHALSDGTKATTKAAQEAPSITEQATRMRPSASLPESASGSTDAPPQVDAGQNDPSSTLVVNLDALSSSGPAAGLQFDVVLAERHLFDALIAQLRQTTPAASEPQVTTCTVGAAVYLASVLECVYPYFWPQ